MIGRLLWTFAAIIMLLSVIGGSEGADYDYQQQTFNAVVGQCYDSNWIYDPGPGVEEGPQRVATVSCFKRSGYYNDDLLGTGLVYNTYLRVRINGDVVDVRDTPLTFVTTDDALVVIAGYHWYTYSIKADLVRSSLNSEIDMAIFGPQILKRRVQ